MSIQLLTASILASLWCALVVPPPAHAYLDPGTAGYMIQLLIGGLLAAGYTFRNFIGNLFKPFLRKQSQPPASGSVDPPEPGSTSES